MKPKKGFLAIRQNHRAKKPRAERRGAKGFIYTLFVMAVLLSLSLFILVQEDHTGAGTIAEKIRGDEVGFFVRGAQDDVGRGVLISGRKALVSIVSDEVNLGRGFPDANESILELMINGTFGGENSTIMENSTILAWEESIRQIGRGRNIDINISTKNIRISPSAFEVLAAGNTTLTAYDPLTRIRYNRTFFLQQAVSIEGLEDPYVTVKSLGAVKNTVKKCDSDSGIAPASQWTYGTAYVSNDADCTAVLSKATKIFITDTMDSKPTCSGFNATVTADDSASGAYYLRNAAKAFSAAKNDSYVVLSNNRLWLANFTSCYFEAPDGPSFLDRLEGRGAMSAKYNVSGAIEGIAAFLYIPPAGYVLDYVKYP